MSHLYGVQERLIITSLDSSLAMYQCFSMNQCFSKRDRIGMLPFLLKHLQLAGVEGQRVGKLCSSGEGGTDGKDLPVCICMCGSAHDCRCVVDDSNAMAAS